MKPLRERRVQNWINRRRRDHLRKAIIEEMDLDNERNIVIH